MSTTQGHNTTKISQTAVTASNAVFALRGPVRQRELLESHETHPVRVALVGFAARTADTVAAALLRTAALYLAGGEKVEKFRKPAKELVTAFLVELLKLIRRERKKKRRGTKKGK